MRTYNEYYKNKRLGDYGIPDPISGCIKLTPSTKIDAIRELNKMATLRENATQYEAPKTKNVADLASINVMQNIYTKEVGVKGEEGYFKYDYIEVNGEEYRVPVSVKIQIKSLIEEYPDLTEVKVKRSGEGLKTTYTVLRIA